MDHAREEQAAGPWTARGKGRGAGGKLRVWKGRGCLGVGICRSWELGFFRV